ncbi:Adenylate cyclase, class 3 [Nitrosomonas cryotolerans]|uniref:Adenylate cyclase, class 3 n=1 Tax=Nitrosomonas cryotolerans ATCC 49181 TaxID=1131553 RepID=A0A1N6J1Y2_9PROT|nr:adenylate/guanylate cyclase domain-containing protein [Nitrosomonas cryotolerans]SFP53475.1 Adenylate cyclase, class 3 [Nitrosomonas cryotolerans]SIO38261.1 Adenylate cyclase, class 3 [Nitrosomonas cryotolerans ATCC 49181]
MNFIYTVHNMAIIKTLNDTSSATPCITTRSISITSLEQSVWHELESNVAVSLNRLHIEQLFKPTVLLLHQLVTNAIDTLHYTVFQKIVDADFYINIMNSDAALKALYQEELTEHGDRNIAKFCEINGFQIILAFPNEGDAIVSISVPNMCENAIFLNKKLADALEYRLHKEDITMNSNYYIGTLTKHKAKQSSISPVLLTQQSERSSLQGIFSQLGYGIVCFSSLGSILAVSPSIFISLHMNASASAIQILAKSIPEHFYNDVIWGLALETVNGVFDNYRVRMRSLRNPNASMLFNVSGYCDDHATIHTLWQTVSFDGQENSTLSEGSILNEARVHNITRNYVPQLVEEKAREIVRLGGNKLINEACFIAVLFCDIVGFTNYVENNEKEESIIHTLNSILRRISKSVKDHGGLIDKFMGDCVMVLFRNPHDAVIAALEMQSHSIDIIRLRERAGQEVLQLRIGIHWGKVIIGNVGTSERLDWTTIGDVVNTASRIEKKCQPGEVLISQTMRDVITTRDHTDIKYGEIFYLQVKGKRNKLAVCYAYPP